MSARRLPPRRPTRTGAAASRVALAGAAGLAALIAVAPAASALDDPVIDGTGSDDTRPLVPEVEPEPEAPEATVDPELESAPAAAVAPPAEGGEEAEPPLVALAPNFGFQKYRVGVQIADGTYVPAGTTTAGTEFTITETFQDGSTFTFTCTTSAETTAEDGSTYCLEEEAEYPETPDEPGEELADAPVARAVADPGVVVDPEDTDDDDAQLFQLEPGATVSVAITATPPKLRGITTSASVDPCVAPDLGVVCVNSSGGNQVSAITFSLVGLPPIAVDDTARTRVDVPVDIALLPNDDTVLGAPLTAIALASSPSNGTATLVGNVARYTPARGFTGTDSFTYSISTLNGTATARVRVVVEGGVVQSVLPNTGGPEIALLGLGALLVVGGGWSLTRGRPEALEADVTV